MLLVAKSKPWYFSEPPTQFWKGIAETSRRAFSFLIDKTDQCVSEYLWNYLCCCPFSPIKMGAGLVKNLSQAWVFWNQAVQGLYHKMGDFVWKPMTWVMQESQNMPYIQYLEVDLVYKLRASLEQKIQTFPMAHNKLNLREIIVSVEAPLLELWPWNFHSIQVCLLLSTYPGWCFSN